MIYIIFLFALLVQVAYGGLLPRESPDSSGCIKSSMVPSAVKCHQLIGAFSRKCPSGHSTTRSKNVQLTNPEQKWIPPATSRSVANGLWS
jgi:hypothetical protein